MIRDILITCITYYVMKGERMPKRKHIDPKAVERLNEVFEEAGLSLSKFADSLYRPNYETSSQNVHRYLKGENEMPASFAQEVARVYGVNASWLLGLSPYRTPVDESAARLAEFQADKKRRRILFELMAQMNGWKVEPRPDVAAPATPSGDAFDMTESATIAFDFYESIQRGDERHDLDRIDFDKFVSKVLAYFDFEISHR